MESLNELVSACVETARSLSTMTEGVSFTETRKGFTIIVTRKAYMKSLVESRFGRAIYHTIMGDTDVLAKIKKELIKVLPDLTDEEIEKAVTDNINHDRRCDDIVAEWMTKYIVEE